jgi:hypothetical protein
VSPVSTSAKLKSATEKTWFVSSPVVTVLSDAVGASLTGSTVTVKLSVTEALALSVALMVMVAVPFWSGW